MMAASDGSSHRESIRDTELPGEAAAIRDARAFVLTRGLTGRPGSVAARSSVVAEPSPHSRCPSEDRAAGCAERRVTGSHTVLPLPQGAPLESVGD